MTKPRDETEANRAEKIFREAVAFVQQEYGPDAELQHPQLVLAYVTARVAGRP